MTDKMKKPMDSAGMKKIALMLGSPALLKEAEKRDKKKMNFENVFEMKKEKKKKKT
tara:strand:+ start:76 stop:243 length:168 start_codon:yes stop_codon:yes gene_type:complete